MGQQRCPAWSISFNAERVIATRSRPTLNLKMVSRSDAYAICYAQINQSDIGWPDKPEIVVTSTVEREQSWVFYYQSKPYVDHGDFGQSLVGNRPCVVLKSDGRFAFTATFPPIEERVSKVEAWLLTGGDAGTLSVVAHK